MPKCTLLEKMKPIYLGEYDDYKVLQTPCNCTSSWDDRQKELRQLEKTGEEDRDLYHGGSPKKGSTFVQALREHSLALNYLARCRQDYDAVCLKGWLPPDTKPGFARFWDDAGHRIEEARKKLVELEEQNRESRNHSGTIMPSGYE